MQGLPVNCPGQCCTAFNVSLYCSNCSWLSVCCWKLPSGPLKLQACYQFRLHHNLYETLRAAAYHTCTDNSSVLCDCCPVQGAFGDLESLLPSVTDSILHELLQLAIHRAYLDNNAAADLLLKYDRQHLHLLHDAPGGRDPNVAEQRRLQGLPSVQEVMVQLFNTCIANGNRTMAAHLRALPAAKCIGE